MHISVFPNAIRNCKTTFLKRCKCTAERKDDYPSKSTRHFKKKNLKGGGEEYCASRSAHLHYLFTALAYTYILKHKHGKCTSTFHYHKVTGIWQIIPELAKPSHNSVCEKSPWLPLYNSSFHSHGLRITPIHTCIYNGITAPLMTRSI